MSITIDLISPLNGQRQVAASTDIEFSLSVGANIDTLNVRINGTDAILGGVVQEVISRVEGDHTETRFIPLTEDHPFQVGEYVDLDTNDGYFDNRILTLETVDGYNGIKLQDGVGSVSNQSIVRSKSRGYEASIVGSAIVGYTIVLSPRADLQTNSMYMVIIDVEDQADFYTKEVFTFKTTDTLPPQIMNLPTHIENSNISFTLVDFLQNEVNVASLNVFIDGVKVINGGVYQSEYVGKITSTSHSELEIYLKPRKKFRDQQHVSIDIQVSDAVGNISSYNQELVNRSLRPEITILQLDPIRNTILDPLNTTITLHMRSDLELDSTFMNVGLIKSGQISSLTNTELHPIIYRGEFVDNQLGTLLVGRDIYITLTNPTLVYNETLELLITVQEIDDEGESVGPELFNETIEYKTITTRHGPMIDTFSPSSEEIASPTAQMSFRVLSVIDRDPIDIDTLNVAVNNILAIDEGNFVNNYTGEIAIVQNSDGNAIEVTLQSTTSFEIASLVEVAIDVKDAAQNLSVLNTSFNITDTSVPILSFDPPSGVYNELIRITIEANQSAQIYYTLDGSVPTIGKLNTFIGTSPVVGIPVFSQGITQVKAFALSDANIASIVETKIYDVNQFPPIITIVSPEENHSQDATTASIEYSIELERGFLSRVEYSLNNGVKIDTANTLNNSSVLITGLTTGLNNIDMSATDNAGNVGTASIAIFVNPARIDQFLLNYAPVKCPEFTNRTAPTRAFFNSFLDTQTVVLMGYGSRRQILIDYAIGSAEDGRPEDFKAGNLPDGRHFEVSSFPIIEGSQTVRLVRQGRELILNEVDYEIDFYSGQIVLDHPLELGETLAIDFIAETDINTPELYLPSQTSELYAKHGQPSQENILSLAAELAFENGATRVLAIQPRPFEEDSNWTETFNRLELEQGYWFVPVVGSAHKDYYATFRAATLSHADQMSEIQNKKERVLLGARIESETNGLTSKRGSLIYVDQNPTINRIVQGENTSLHPSLVAAAMAGRLSSFANVATSPTYKTISGFTLGNLAQSTQIDLDKLLRDGFLPVQALSSGGKIYRGRTSTLSGSAIEEEISIQRTLDFIAKNLRKNLENLFGGQNVTDALVKNMQEASESFLSRQPISNFVVQAAVNTSEPRQVDLSIDITPLFPLNQIAVNLTISTKL